MPARGSRSLLEHIEAVGHYLWKERSADVLLDGARDAIIRRAATWETKKADFTFSAMMRS